jgi:hypothetical protein
MLLRRRAIELLLIVRSADSFRERVRRNGLRGQKMGSQALRFETICRLNIAVLMACAVLLSPRTAVGQMERESCQDTVDGFYKWYVPKAITKSSNGLDAWEFAIKTQAAVFSRELLELLRGESTIQDKNQDAGLDFDPFLNTQDTAGRYVVDKVELRSGICRAEIFGIYSGMKAKRPDVVSELIVQDGRWVFATFYYKKSVHPENADLLSLLRFRERLRQQRK